ncbi:winged helix-turn-helix domain-containing protein [Collibacillus ludicampi]
MPEKAYDGFVDDHPLNLTNKEYELLKYFVCNKEQILTRGQILDRVWGIDADAADSVVDLYVHYLRKISGSWMRQLYQNDSRGGIHVKARVNTYV